MANSEEKVSKFVQAITSYAEEQREKIRQETEAFKTERMQKAEQEVLADAYQLIQKETAEIRGQGVLEISRRELAARKEVLSRRKQIMTEIFDRAEKKILEYTATPKYTDQLYSLLTEMITVLPAEGTVYYLAPRDTVHFDNLQSLCPKGSRFETAEDIRIGGIRGVNNGNGLIADNTLDLKLELQREWFTKTSGLEVG